MVFSSLEFLFVFIPAVFAIYYIVPPKFRNVVLLLGSIAFYVYGTIEQPLYIVLFLLSSFVNWFIGLRIGKRERRSRLWLILGLLYNFGWLFVFKYAGFFFRTAQTLLDRIWPLSGVNLPAVDLILPIGISFYTFQIVSYLIDVYRGTIKAERSLLHLATYLYMFPQLIAGPIVTFSSMQQQLRAPKISMDRINDGLREFTIGLGLKVLLANRIGSLWSDIGDIGYDSISTPLAWMGAVAFALQIYFDFYGYSLMAIGLGRMLGFEIPENFRHPYTALTVTDFWRRWHITLSSWFRDYLYIPLGGNRVRVPRHIFNLLIVWISTGFWHGANWNFILWGFLFFCLLVLEKFAIKSILERFPVLGHGYMILIIPLSFLVFAITDLGDLAIYFERLFPFLPGEPINIMDGDYLKYGAMYGVLLLIGIVFCTEWPRRIYERIKHTIWGTLILLAIFWGSVYYLYLGLNDPFLYFRF